MFEEHVRRGPRTEFLPNRPSRVGPRHIPAPNAAVQRHSTPDLRQIEAIQIHHLVPGRNKVVHELLLRIARRIGLRDGSQLSV